LGFEVEQGNLRQQIKNIADNSEYEHNKRLAEYLLDFNFDKNDFFRFAEDFAEDFEEFGLYYKDENGVKNISIKANKIAKEIPLSNRQYFEEQVLLHETIHLLTVDNLNKSKEVKKEISKLMQVAKSKLDISKYNNAFSSEAEFIAHAFSDYNFQKELKSIPYEKSNVWNKFISLIQDMAKYLGINVENSLLEKIVEVSQPLFNNQITPQQKQQALQVYSQYLDIIFPDSKVKDIVYHGTKSKEEFSKFITEREYPIQLPHLKGKVSKGVFFTKNKNIADVAGIRTVKALLNMKNPLNRNKGSEYLFKEDVDEIQKNNDSLIAPGNEQEYIVFEPEQIHILGSKQDIEGFKEFVNNGNFENAKENNVENFQLTKITPNNLMNKLQSLGFITQTKFMDNYWIKKGRNQENAIAGDTIYDKNLLQAQKFNEQYKKDGVYPLILSTKDKGTTVAINPNYIKTSQKRDLEKRGIPDEELDAKVSEFLKKLGVKVNLGSVTTIYGTPIENAIARAKYVKSNAKIIVDITEGLQGLDTLTEEAVHVMLWMMRGTPLYQVMYKDIVNFKGYQRIKEEYAGVYTSEVQFREEVIAKLITESVIKQHKEGTKLSQDQYYETKRLMRWANSIIEFFNRLFSQYKTNPYDYAAMKLLFQDLEDLKMKNIGESSEAFQIAEPSLLDIKNKITSRNITKRRNVKEDKDEYIEDDYVYNYRVTEKTSDFNKDRTEEEKRQDKFSAQIGDAVHEDFNNAIIRESEIRTNGHYKTAKVSNFSKFTRNKIEGLVTDIFNSFGKDAIFLSEHTIGNKNTKTAGTTDVIVIHKDKKGKTKVTILDFKTMKFQTDDKGKVFVVEMPVYKKKNYQKQLQEYKTILKEGYGITAPIDAFLIPIHSIVKNNKNTDKLELTGLDVGEFGYMEEKKYLMPVPMETNTSSDETVNEVLRSLIAQRDKIVNTEAVTDEQKIKKGNRIQALNETIKKVLLTDDLNSFFDEFNSEFSIIMAEQPTVNNIRFAGELLEFYKNLNFFDYKQQFKDDQDSLDLIKAKTADFREKVEALDKFYKDNLNTVVTSIAQTLGVSNISIPQKDIGYWSRLMSYFSSSSNPHIQSLYRLFVNTKDRAKDAFETDLEKITELEKGLKEYADNRGLKLEEVYELFIKRDKYGNIQMSDKYKKEIWEKIAVARTNKDFAYLSSIYNFDKARYEERKEKDLAYMAKKYAEHPDRDIILKKHEDYLEKNFDVTSSNSAYLNKDNWYLTVNDSALASYQSKEFKEISSNPQLKAFYDYLTTYLKDSRKELGLDVDFKFLPQTQKSLIEALESDGTELSFKDRLYDELSMSETGNFGEVNVLTGEQEYNISMPYQAKLGKNASVNLAKSLALWSKSYHEVKRLREVEDAAILLKQHLETQQFFQTDALGNRKKDEEGNDILTTAKGSNTLEAYNGFLKEAVYRVKGKGTAISKTRKRPVFNKDGTPKVDEEGKPVYEEYKVSLSVDKMIQKVLSWISAKGLGFNIISAGANLGGGLANGYFLGNDGRFYNKTQFTKAIKMVSGGSMNPQAKALMAYFDIQGNLEGFNKANALSISAADKFLTYDKVYELQKKGDFLILNSILFALLQSHGLDSKGNIKPLDRLPEGTKSIMDSVEIEGDNIKITGLTDAANRQAYYDFRRKSLEIGKKILGSTSDYDIRIANQTIAGRVLMQFRNWLPRMAEERFSVQTRYNANLQDFEKGKFISFLGSIQKENLGVLTKALVGFGADFDTMLERKWNMLSQEKKEVFLNNTSSEEEAKLAFIALEKGNIKSAALELRLVIILTSLLMLLKGDDDDDKDTPAIKFSMKMLDRLYNEVGFFANPFSTFEILKSPIASSNTILDGARLLEHLFGDTAGTILGNEELKKKYKPTKYIYRQFPVLKEIVKNSEIMFGEDSIYE
jgi:hypothetical protein